MGERNMSAKFVFSGLVICFVAFTSTCLAQSAQPSPAPQPTTPGGQAAPTINPEVLHKYLMDQKKRVDDLDAIAKKGIDNALKAGELYDRMIKEYQDLAERFGSNGPLAKDMDAFVDFYEKRADQQSGSANPELRKDALAMRDIAKKTREIRQEFIKEADKAFSNIERLRSLKDEATSKFLVDKGNEVNAAWEAQLKIFKETNEHIEKTTNDFEKTLPKKSQNIN
jgi:hypothetical protein